MKKTTAPTRKEVTKERKQEIAKAIKTLSRVEESEWAWLFGTTRQTLNNWFGRENK